MAVTSRFFRPISGRRPARHRPRGEWTELDDVSGACQQVVIQRRPPPCSSRATKLPSDTTAPPDDDQQNNEQSVRDSPKNVRDVHVPHKAMPRHVIDLTGPYGNAIHQHRQLCYMAVFRTRLENENQFAGNYIVQYIDYREKNCKQSIQSCIYVIALKRQKIKIMYNVHVS